MQTAAFDTLATVNALKEAGFEDVQAVAIVVVLRHAVVTEEITTKADLSKLRAELKADNAEAWADRYRALGRQAAGIIGLTVALLKIL